MSDSSRVPKWDRLTATPILSTPVFAVERRRMEQSSTGPGARVRSGDFFVIDAPDWVNVLAYRKDGQAVLIEQWRQGVERITLEIPGGMVDPGETPLEAARRELLEETGYAAQVWHDLGSIEPNPAIQNNRCHTFVALDCREVEAPAFDSHEHCIVRLIPDHDLDGLVSNGAITHALVVVALMKERLRRAATTSSDLLDE